MVIGSLGYVVNDALVRAATEEGLGVYQTLFVRSIAMAVLLGVGSRVRGQRLRRIDLRGPLVLRVAAELVAAALFFAALVHLEFANAQTILLLVPFAVTLVASIYLGEAVSTRQYVVVLAGFAGVVAVVRPATTAFSGWSLMVVGSAAILVVREFATRQIDDDTPALPIALLTAVALAALTGVLSIFNGWGEITPAAAGLVGLACVSLAVGYVFTIQTVRVGDLSVSAPFRYTTLLGAVVIGIWFFDETPDALTVLGCTVIVVAGIYAIRLDRSRMAELPHPN